MIQPRVMLPVLISFILCKIGFCGVRISDSPDCKNKDFDCVGKVYKQDNTFVGSCVFLSDEWAITALHVVSDKNFDPYDPKLYYLLDDNGNKIEIKEFEYTDNKDDICLLKINKAPKNVTKISFTEVQKGTELYFSGWGLTCSNPDPSDIIFDPELPKERTTFKNILDDYFCIKISSNKNKVQDNFYFYGLYDLSQKDKAIKGEGIIAPGDSGSGVFIKDGDKFKLIGISVALNFNFCKEEDKIFPYNPFTTHIKDISSSFIPLCIYKDFINKHIKPNNNSDWYE